MKMKRKALSVLSCLALIASSLPSTAVFVSAAETTTTSPGDPQYVTIKEGEKTTYNVFANGTDIEVAFDATKGTNTVTWLDAEGAKNKIQSVPTNANVFAGCHGSATPVGTADKPVKITIDGAHLNTVCGGGLHESIVENVEITVKGEAQLNWVCGGGANCLIKDNENACQDKGWKNDAANSATLVKKAVVNIEAGTVANAVYGGGEGYSKTENTTVNIKGGKLNSVCASGSNGATGNSEVNIESGTITYVYSVNRGNLTSSDITVTGGEITNLYIGAASYPNITGTVTKSNVDITGGTVKELHAGKSNNETLDVSQEGYSFSANPSSVEKYNADIQEKKDKENAYYYYDVYLNNDEKDNLGNSAANKLDKIVNVVKGSNQKDYQVVYVVANGYKVEATDVVEDGAWKATKITCEDGSYVKTNYDIVNLFGGKHNDDSTTVNGDITLDGTTHVKYVFGGGWHKSSTGTAKVTIKNNAEVYRVQGGASSFLSYDNANCGVQGCDGCNYEANKNKECWKPNGDPTTADYAEAKARVESAEVIIDGCKNSYSDPISGTTLKTIVYGGGESYAYTGSATVTVKSGTVETVYAAGSNGNTATAEANVEGGTVNSLASAKSGKVGEVTVNVKDGEVKELVVGAHANVHGMASVDSAKVTVSGGTVTKVIDGDVDQNGETKNTETNKEKYDIVADGGTITEITGSSDSSAAEYGEAGNIDCHHDKYAKLEETKGTSATCQAAGTYDYWKCSNCKRYIIVKDGEYEDVTNEQGDGVVETKIVMESGPTHHVYDGEIIVTVDAKCLTDGMKSYTVCTACGKQKAIVTDENGEYIKEVAADKSKYQYTDTKDGVATKITDEDLVIPKLNHSPKTVPAIESTCTSEGRTAWVMCDRDGCGVTIVAPTTTPKKDHTYGQEIAEKKATCKDPGTKAHYQCSVCKNLFVKDGDVYTQVTEDQLVIPVTEEHTWGEYTSNNDATCTTPGTKTAECTVCGAKDTKEDTDNPAKGHSYLENLKEEVPATCTEDGIKAHYECTVCGAKFVEKITEQEAPAEPLKEYIEVTEENYDELLKIPALGHNEVKLEAVAATCTATGLTEGLKCDRCGEVLVPQTVVPTIPHKNDLKLEAVKETCETWGLTEGVKCSVCGTITTPQTLIPPLGHDYDANGVCKRDGATKPGIAQPTQPTQPQAPTTAGPKVSVKVLKITQAKLTKLKVKSKAKNKINVSWKKVANAKGYQVEVSKSSSFKSGAKVLTKSTKNLKLTIKNKKLKSGKTYYVRARAYTTYKAADGSTKKAYSNWNYVLRKVKVK